MPLLLTHAAQLLTMAGPDRGRRGAEMSELGLLRDGAVLIEGDRILAVGATDAVARQAARLQPLEELDCRGRLVTPGLIDAHTHLVFPAPRLDDFERRVRGESYAAIAAAGGGIACTVRAVHATDDAALLAATEAHLRALRRWGVTTVEIKSGYGLSTAQELRLLNVAARAAAQTGTEVALTFLGAHAVPAEFAGRRGEYVALVAGEMLAAASAAEWPAADGQTARVEFADVYCDHGAFTVAEAETIFRAAAARGLKLKIHAEQLAWTGATQLATRWGAVSADHLEHTTAADHRALAHSATVATLLPGCALFLGTAYPPALALIEAGACVALASDFNPGSSPVSSLPLIMSLACTQMRMTPAEAWTAATINAAAALDRTGQVGALAPGKRANVAIFAEGDFRAVPYHLGVNLCQGVVQNGRYLPLAPH